MLPRTFNYPKHSLQLAFPCGSQVQNASSFTILWNPLQFIKKRVCVVQLDTHLPNATFQPHLKFPLLFTWRRLSMMSSGSWRKPEVCGDSTSVNLMPLAPLRPTLRDGRSRHLQNTMRSSCAAGMVGCQITRSRMVLLSAGINREQKPALPARGLGMNRGYQY